MRMCNLKARETSASEICQWILESSSSELTLVEWRIKRNTLGDRTSLSCLVHLLPTSSEGRTFLQTSGTAKKERDYNANDEGHACTRRAMREQCWTGFSDQSKFKTPVRTSTACRNRRSGRACIEAQNQPTSATST